MILGDPDGFWLAVERMGIKPGDARYPDEVVAAYRAQLDDPATVEAICEDYRAGATIDRALDDADRGARTIACPVRALWGGAGALPRFYEDPLELWRPYAPESRAGRSRAPRTSSSRTRPARSPTTSPRSSPRARRLGGEPHGQHPAAELRRLGDLQVVPADAVPNRRLPSPSTIGEYEEHELVDEALVEQPLHERRAAPRRAGSARP